MFIPHFHILKGFCYGMYHFVPKLRRKNSHLFPTSLVFPHNETRGIMTPKIPTPLKNSTPLPLSHREVLFCSNKKYGERGGIKNGSESLAIPILCNWPYTLDSLTPEWISHNISQPFLSPKYASLKRKKRKTFLCIKVRCLQFHNFRLVRFRFAVFFLVLSLFLFWFRLVPRVHLNPKEKLVTSLKEKK